MKRTIASLAALVTALVSLVAVAPAGAQVPQAAVVEITAGKTPGVYVVLLDEAPAVAYQGDRSPDEHVRHLTAAHDEVLGDAGVAASAKLYDYLHATNGFAAELTAEEATRIANHQEVLAVFPDEIRQLTTNVTDSSPDFLELSHQQGPWAAGYTGEDVVIGVIDTGIWPEHPSFADTGYGPPPPGFTGSGCELGGAVAGAQSFNPADEDFECNNKLLSAKTYGLGFHGGAGDGLAKNEYLSARDGHGHGTHTASIAAGNPEVEANVLGADWGTVSGVAPRARVAAYKACWSPRAGVGRCATSDLVAAIDDAVADGVDVINYSIGPGWAVVGPDDISFLFAAAAGVLVATSAGNDGARLPTTSPPWVTSVAAATQAGSYRGAVILGDDTTITGTTLTGGTDELPLVDAARIGNERCDPDIGFWTDIDNSIVFCHDGEVSDAEKSRAVQEHGGAGMVLAAEQAGDPLDPADLHLPWLRVTGADGETIAEYIATEGTEAVAFLAGGVRGKGQGSVMASFASRGPNGLSPNLLKPDVVAPGVDILAGRSPSPGLPAPDQLFSTMSGSSMASPHVAGTFALFRQAHPEWTPAMAKSALMTTSRHRVWKDDGATPADAFDMGGGYIQPGGVIYRRGSAFNPGLVYDTGLFDYAAFACGSELGGVWVPEDCGFIADAGFPTDPSDLNLPSIAIADLIGSKTVTRTVTSVADKLRVFESRVKAPPGFDVEVSPATVTLEPGESAEFTVTFIRTRAPTGEWSFGSLTWATEGYRVVSPVAVRAVDLMAPEEIVTGGSEGEASFGLDYGYDGEYTAGVLGLVAADTEEGTVADDPESDINAALASGVGISQHWVTVPEGTAHTRVSLVGDRPDGDDDLDLYVFAPDGSFITGSGSATSREQVDFVPEQTGSHRVVVHGWHTDEEGSGYSLSSWSVPAEPDERWEVTTAPETAAVATTGSVEISWVELEPDTDYLGVVAHTESAPKDDEEDDEDENEPEMLGLTLVAIDTTGPTPIPGARSSSTDTEDDSPGPPVAVPHRIAASLQSNRPF